MPTQQNASRARRRPTDTILPMQGPLSVLVTDAEERSAVAACESLNVAGYRVGAASHLRFAPAQWSRFSNARFRTPNPRASSRQFAEEVAAIARQNGFAAVIPASDGSVIALSSHRDLFTGIAELGLPSSEVVADCVSKTSLMEKAVDVGLSAPETIVCADQGEVMTAARQLGYPVLLKPRSTVFSYNGHTRQRGSSIAWDEAALEVQLPEYGFPCLLQRREQGQILSIGGVFAEGKLLATAPSRYIRTWQPDAGSVSFSKSIVAPAHLTSRVEDLLTALKWEGIFELELIEMPDGNYAVIDFNPRLYGSLALAVEGGAPLPSIWCDWLLTGRTSGCTVRPGVFYRWLDADLRHAWRFLRKGRVADAISVLRPRSKTAHPFLRGNDPVPEIARLVQMLHYAISKNV